jgi:3-oxoacyl-[acyl-carrier-protein] synthase-3
LPNARITGTGGYVPPRIVKNEDLVASYGIETDNEWIIKRTGIEARRFAEEGVGSSDLALPAAREAMERAGVGPKDLGMVVFATLSPEHCFPGSGVYLQHKLGLPNTPAMDIRNQCSGFVYGLTAATGLVKSGIYQHVLVVGAEVHSAALDLSTRGRTVSTLFGDGAGAVVVSATDEDRGVRAVHLGADGQFADVLAQRIWDIRKRPFIPLNEEGVGQVQPEMMWANMDGRLVFRHAVEKMILALMQVCWQQKITTNDLDLVLFHQANLRINQYVQQQLGLPDEKVMHNIQRYGNTTAATIPLLLAEAESAGRLKPGMKVALVAFGSGFTWGAVLLDW